MMAPPQGPGSAVTRAMTRRGGGPEAGGDYEQCGHRVLGAEARIRSVLQPLVRREVPEGRTERRSVQRALQKVPGVREESHPGKRNPY